MKSRITIEVDFANERTPNQPVLQIISRESDDVRDKLIKSFLQSFHGSGLCSIRWEQHYEGVDDNFKRIVIRPISLMFGIPDVKNEQQLKTFFETGMVLGNGGQIENEEPKMQS